MIVEDEILVALAIEKSLERFGYKIVAKATDGPTALASRYTPDLIMMDIRLKGEIDGIEAAERIMGEMKIPVVYLTAHSDDRTLERAKRSPRPGGRGVIRSPSRSLRKSE